MGTTHHLFNTAYNAVEGAEAAKYNADLLAWCEASLRAPTGAGPREGPPCLWVMEKPLRRPDERQSVMVQGAEPWLPIRAFPDGSSGADGALVAQAFQERDQDTAMRFLAIERSVANIAKRLDTRGPQKTSGKIPREHMCQSFMHHGTCRWGARCRFSHRAKGGHAEEIQPEISP